MAPKAGTVGWKSDISRFRENGKSDRGHRVAVYAQVHAAYAYQVSLRSRQPFGLGSHYRQTDKPSGVGDLRLWQPRRIWAKCSLNGSAVRLDRLKTTIFAEIVTRMKCLKRPFIVSSCATCGISAWTFKGCQSKNLKRYRIMLKMTIKQNFLLYSTIPMSLSCDE